MLSKACDEMNECGKRRSKVRMQDKVPKGPKVRWRARAMWDREVGSPYPQSSQG